MHRRNGLVLTVRAINPVEEWAGALYQGQGFAGPFQPTAVVSAPLSCITPSPLFLQGGPMSHQQLHLLRNHCW